MKKNRYLNHLVDPKFQGVNRLFVLAFENGSRTSKSRNKRLQCYD